METLMGPPLLPGYSLRVMLFRANAYSEGDRPIRCFRVVTSPDATVREFCQEASRIHEINYGEPIAIKKVQDDQEFDITQGEVLGSLFSNLSTIRVIQANNHPGVRDSLPPTSGLRFEPGTSRKRDREESVRPNGSTKSNSWNPNKRQRVLDVDPDQPLPSREIETNGRRLSFNVIPDSQDSIASGASNGVYAKPRHVRKALPRISETPSPPPSLRKATSKNGFADHRDNQSDIQSSNGGTILPAQKDRSTPPRDTIQRAQSHASNQPRGKSASYHIPRSFERGASVSTAATSPLSIDQHLPPRNHVAATNEGERQEPILPPHIKRTKRSPNEKSIYENITSDEEGFGFMRARKTMLKQKSSPGAGLPGFDRANKKFNTPPNGSHRGSGNNEPATTPGELTLTPKSKEREEKKLLGIEIARKAGIAAAEAAEKRKREADEARQTEENRVAAEERAKREEQERIDVEEFKRGEAERKAAIAKAARLQKETEVREKKEAEEQRRREESHLAKDKANQERLEKEKAAETGRLKKGQQGNLKTRLPSSSPEEEQAPPPKSSSPILPRGTPGSRAHSGTPFIPPRKSALKSVMSSQAMRSSSPAGSSRSPGVSSNGVGIEAQMPLPKSNRRVSFKKEVEHDKSPILPPGRTPSRILPPTKTQTSTPPSITPKKSAIKPVVKTPPVELKSQSPSTAILPPKRPSLERSVTPTVISKATTPAKILPTTKGTSPAVAAKKISPPASQLKGNQTPVHPPMPKERSTSSSEEPSRAKSYPTFEAPSRDSDSDEEILENAPSTVAKPVRPEADTEKSESSDSEGEDATEKQEADEDETQSQNSSIRDSRSPVSFIQHPKTVEPFKPIRAASPQSVSSSEDEEMQDAMDIDEVAIKDSVRASFNEPKKEENSDSDSSDSDPQSDHGIEVQVPQSSPPMLPAHRSTTKPNLTKNSKRPFRDEIYSTQDQVDHQLTSSLYEARNSFPATSTPTPVPTASAAIRPPTIKFGASLSSLNQNKSAFGVSSQLKPVSARSGQLRPKLPIVDDNEESDSDESESDDSSSSSDDDVSNIVRPTRWAASKKEETSQNDNSDSEGSDNDEEAEKRRAGNELAAQIAAMRASSQVSVVVPSPKMYNLSTQPSSTPRIKEKKAEKKRDKYTSGYVFSQVR